jgi:hypothetical protein
MANQLDTAHILGVSAITDVGGECVTIGGTQLRAVVGDMDVRDELAEGGVRQIRSVRLAIPRSEFERCVAMGITEVSIPAIWSRITVRDIELQVLAVAQDAAVVEITAGGLAE